MESKGARMEKERNDWFFPRRAANAGITNRRPAARQRPAVLKQTASASTLCFSLFFPSIEPSRRVYARAMANRDWPAVNAPFVPN